MDDAEMLRALGVDPAALDPAPARMRGHLEERVGLPCVACPAPADYPTIVDVPGFGRRWVDCCRAHFLAVMKRPATGPPRPLEELLAEVRQVAAEVGVPRRIVIDGDVHP